MSVYKWGMMEKLVSGFYHERLTLPVSSRIEIPATYRRLISDNSKEMLVDMVYVR